jgi:flagellin
MPISLYSNVQSLNAQRNLGKTQFQLSSALSRLSSGQRINTAADDAPGLAISERLRSQIRSLSQAERNSYDGMSMLQTAEGAMNETYGMLSRMRELAVQASNATLGTIERGYLNQEYQSLQAEITRVATVTTFNGTQLLDGTATGLRIQVGINAGANDAILVSMQDMRATALGGAATFVSAQTLTSIATAQASIGVIDAAIGDVSTARGAIGAFQNRLVVAAANLSSSRENLSAADSRIRDADIAEETAAMTRNNILMQAGVSVLAQANQLPSLALSLLQG